MLDFAMRDFELVQKLLEEGSATLQEVQEVSRQIFSSCHEEAVDVDAVWIEMLASVKSGALLLSSENPVVAKRPERRQHGSGNSALFHPFTPVHLLPLQAAAPFSGSAAVGLADPPLSSSNDHLLPQLHSTSGKVPPASPNRIQAFRKRKLGAAAAPSPYFPSFFDSISFSNLSSRGRSTKDD
ncbi:hypothetical protein Ndes2526B_g04934 [Nannochloris sp. 'desiccata']